MTLEEFLERAKPSWHYFSIFELDDSDFSKLLEYRRWCDAPFIDYSIADQITFILLVLGENDD